MVEAGLPMQPLCLGDWYVGALDSHEDDVPEASVDAATREALMAQWRSKPRPTACWLPIILCCRLAHRGWIKIELRPRKNFWTG